MEFYQLEYHRLAWFYGAVCFPYVATIVVTFRAHRGIDVFAAILAAVTRFVAVVLPHSTLFH